VRVPSLRRILLPLWLLAFFTGTTGALAASTYAHIELVEGTATIIDANGQSRPGRIGDKVLEGETIVTGRDGELHGLTDDRGIIAVRPNTKLQVVTFVARGGDEDTSVVSLLAGTIRSITGWIGKYQPKRYSLRTSTATIGIRGTDHEPLFIPAGEPGPGPAGTYEKVNSGTTFIENAAGRVQVGENQAGFAPHDPKVAPKVLEKVPDFYRPTRNEARIRERKEQLVKEIETAREERREAIEKAEKRKAAEAKKRRASQSH
jgi:hypothetical protein